MGQKVICKSLYFRSNDLNNETEYMGKNLHKKHLRERNKLILKVQWPKQVLYTQETKRRPVYSIDSCKRGKLRSGVRLDLVYVDVQANIYIYGEDLGTEYAPSI